MPTSETIENQFTIWPGYAAACKGEKGLFVTDMSNPDPRLRTEFSEVRFVGNADAVFHGHVMARYALYLCSGMHQPAEATTTGRPKLAALNLPAIPAP